MRYTSFFKFGYYLQVNCRRSQSTLIISGYLDLTIYDGMKISVHWLKFKTARFKKVNLKLNYRKNLKRITAVIKLAVPEVHLPPKILFGKDLVSNGTIELLILKMEMSPLRRGKP